LEEMGLRHLTSAFVKHLGFETKQRRPLNGAPLNLFPGLVVTIRPARGTFNFLDPATARVLDNLDNFLQARNT
jgi:hypothetical protein